MKTFTMTRTVGAPVDAVWSIAGDFTRSPGPGVVVSVDRPGDSHANGAKAERTITIGSVRVRERLESLDPIGKSFTYRILSGAPLRDHLAAASFLGRGAETEIRWTVRFRPKIPGTGWIVAAVTRKTISRYLDAVETAVQ